MSLLTAGLQNPRGLRASRRAIRRGRASAVPVSLRPAFGARPARPIGAWGAAPRPRFNLANRPAACRGNCTLLRLARVVMMPRGDPHHPAEEATHECTA